MWRAPGGAKQLNEERSESCLLKMAIAGQGLSNVVLVHHDERNAVRKCPAFVRTLGVQGDAGIEERLTGRDDCAGRVGTKRLN
jgi:5'(3')-deoxyribonucleotidase